MPDSKDYDEILNIFGYHKPETLEGANKHEAVRGLFIEFASTMLDQLPKGRARSLALTNLQQSSMWAHFALAEQNPLVWGNTYGGPPESRSDIMDDHYKEHEKE
jgi:hypothetical protein